MQAEFGLVQEQRNRFYCAESVNADSPFHFHSQIEIYFVVEGEMEVWVNDNRTVLHAGEMSVAFSYDAHCYRSIGQTVGNYIVIPTYMCKEFVDAFQGKQSKTPFIRDPQTVQKLRECYEMLKKDSTNKIKKEARKRASFSLKKSICKRNIFMYNGMRIKKVNLFHQL